MFAWVTQLFAVLHNCDAEKMSPAVRLCRRQDELIEDLLSRSTEFMRGWLEIAANARQTPLAPY